MEKTSTRYETLAELITINAYISMIEIGVGNGDTADYILSKFKYMRYIGIDPYQEYKDYPNDINGTAKRIMRNTHVIHNRIQNWKLEGRNIMIINGYSNQVYSDSKLKTKVDIVFIDGNHTFPYVKEDINLYWSKVENKGIMAFHDYFAVNKFPGVKKAVDQFVRSHQLKLMERGEIVYVIKNHC